jgi:hypothetical protein
VLDSHTPQPGGSELQHANEGVSDGRLEDGTMQTQYVSCVTPEPFDGLFLEPFGEEDEEAEIDLEECVGVAKGEGVSTGVRMGSCTRIEEELTIRGREVKLDVACTRPLTVLEVADFEVGEEGLEEGLMFAGV